MKPRRPRVLWALYDEGGLYGAYQTRAKAHLIALRAPCDDAPYQMPIVKFVEATRRKKAQVKIIRKAKVPKPFTWTCAECKSRIEAKIADGRYVIDARDGDAVVFVCPVCKREQWVSKDKFK